MEKALIELIITATPQKNGVWKYSTQDVRVQLLYALNLIF